MTKATKTKTAPNTKVVDLIKKLLAKANDPSVTESEALQFAAKAQELLESHNMSFLDVPADDASSPIDLEQWAPTYGGDTWRQAVAVSAARVYMCKLLTSKMEVVNSRGKRVVRMAYILVGRESSRAVAKSMIDYLFATAIRLSMAYSPKDQTARRLFERGLGLRLCTRLNELHAAHATAPEGAPKGNLPALYASEADLVQSWIGANMAVGKTRSFKPVRIDRTHSEAGRAAADTISLDSQVEASKASNFLLPA